MQMTSDYKVTRQKASNDYKTLDDIITQRDIIAEEIENSASKIANHWELLTKPPVTNSKAERVAAIISNCLTAYDAFMLVRKITKRYAG